MAGTGNPPEKVSQRHDIGYKKAKANEDLNPPPLTKEQRRWKAEAQKIPYQNLREYLAFKKREKKRNKRKGPM